MFTPTTQKHPLGPTVLRFAGVVQGLVALPCMIQLACSTYLYWSHCYDTWYFFTTHMLAASACLGIIFIAAVQWKAQTTTWQTFKLEALKCVFAEALFLWVTFTHSWHVKRFILTGPAVVVLFWAPLHYAYLEWKAEKEHEVMKENERMDFGNERRQAYTDYPLYTDAKTPLLQGQI